MFVHIGRDVTIPAGTISHVLDLESVSLSKDSREFLTRAEKGNYITNVSEDIPRTAIIANDGNRERVYLTNISAVTIKKRVEMNS